ANDSASPAVSRCDGRTTRASFAAAGNRGPAIARRADSAAGNTNALVLHSPGRRHGVLLPRAGRAPRKRAAALRRAGARARRRGGAAFAGRTNGGGLYRSDPVNSACGALSPGGLVAGWKSGL